MILWKNCKQIAPVYETTNYSMFKEMMYNRDVMESRVGKLVASFSEKEILNPIVVNEKCEIVDGQGRFEALKRLGRPIKFVVSCGANIEDCRRMNAYNTNWTANDFVISYANSGNQNYIRIKKCREMTGFSYNMINRLANKAVNVVKNKKNAWSTNKINTGNLSFTEDDMKSVLLFADHAAEIVTSLALSAKPKDVFYIALKIASAHECYDSARMLQKCKKNRSSFTVMASLEDMLKEFSRVFNYGVQSSSRVYFEDYMRNRGYNSRDYEEQVMYGPQSAVSAKTLRGNK